MLSFAQWLIARHGTLELEPQICGMVINPGLRFWSLCGSNPVYSFQKLLNQICASWRMLGLYARNVTTKGTF